MAFFGLFNRKRPTSNAKAEAREAVVRRKTQLANRAKAKKLADERAKSKIKPNFKKQKPETVGAGVNLRKTSNDAKKADANARVIRAAEDQKKASVKSATVVKPPPKKKNTKQPPPRKPSWRDFKSVGAAKKAGYKSYMGKDGKEKAAVFREELGVGTTSGNAKKRLTAELNKRRKKAKGVPKIRVGKIKIKKPY